MKKLKIMLLSFAILAIVGSALAFKVAFQNTIYCTTDTNNQGVGENVCTSIGGQPGEMQFCDITTTMTESNQGRGSFIKCTALPQNLDGQGPLDDCAVGTNKVRCVTTSLLYTD
jgi:hypothetical protein